jgi:hypothetical protein
MELTHREIWTVLHGMVFGAIFLLAFGGALSDLYSMKAEWESKAGTSRRFYRLEFGMWIVAAIAWITVICGTWIVYVWYRAKPAPGVDLANYPKFLLLSKDSTKGWHEFGMEWKEHVSWTVPMIMTSIAYCITYYGKELANQKVIRRVLLCLLITSFAAAGVAGVFGAFINKIAATR